MAEFQQKLAGSQATGLPGIVSPMFPDDNFGKRVVFNTDKATRRDIQTEIDATRDANYAQIMAKHENKALRRDESKRQEQDMLSQIKESLAQANQRKRSLLY